MFINRECFALPTRKFVERYVLVAVLGQLCIWHMCLVRDVSGHELVTQAEILKCWKNIISDGLFREEIKAELLVGTKFDVLRRRLWNF